MLEKVIEECSNQILMAYASSTRPLVFYSRGVYLRGRCDHCRKLALLRFGNPIERWTCAQCANWRPRAVEVLKGLLQDYFPA